MKNVFYFMLGIALVILTSATTVSVMTIKPQKPKQVAVINTSSLYVRDITYSYIKKGFQIQIVTAPNPNGNLVVVMEKY